MKTILVIALAASLASGSSAAGQPYGGDYFFSNYGYDWTVHPMVGAGLYRLTPAGRLTTLASYAGKALWLNFTHQMDAANRHLIGAGWQMVYEWDAMTNAQLRTMYTTGWITGLSAHHANGFVLAISGELKHISPDLQTWTTISTLKSPYFSIHGQDLWSGDYIIVDDTTCAVSLVSTDGKQTRPVGTYFGGFTSTAIVQSHLDGDFRVFTGSGLLRVDPRTMVHSTLVSGSFIPSAATFDRALGKGAISLFTSSHTLQRMDPSGRVVSTSPRIQVPTWPFMIRHALERDLAAIRKASPNLWWLQLNCPTGAGRPYTIAISMTGFTPGIHVGGRTIPLVPDALFTLSVQGWLFPLLTGNIGTLSANGSGIAILDLRRFGGALTGLKLWAAAAVSNHSAPSGLSLITKPIVLVLD